MGAVEERRNPEELQNIDSLEGIIEKAEAFCREGRFVEAIQLVQNALRVVEELIGAKSPELAQLVILLGHLYLAKADEIQKNEKIRTVVATLHIEKMGNERWEHLILRRMAKADLLDKGEKEIEFRSDEYLAMAMWAKATQVFESALSIQRSVYGPTHPDLVKTMLMLVALYDYFVLEEESRRLKNEAEGIKQRIAASLEASGLRADIWDRSSPSVAASKEEVEAIGQAGSGSALEEYCGIIRQLTEQLTGNEEWDMAFLNEQAELYKEHRWGEEINRALNRLVFYLLPEEKKKDLIEAIGKDKASQESILHEVMIKVAEGCLSEAEDLVKSILPPEDLPVEDGVSIFQAFKEPFERIIYDFKFKPSKRIRPYPDVDTNVFLSYAYILVEKQDFDVAMEVLKRGLKYNPVCVDLLFELGEIPKIQKDFPNFRELTDRCYGFSFRPKDLARVYRNYGYFLIEQEDLEAATFCYILSMHYCHDEKAPSELLYISQCTGKEIDLKKSLEKGGERISRYGIPIGPSEDLLGLSFTAGRDCEEAGSLEDAIYFYGIFAGLSGNEDVLKKVDELRRVLAVNERGLH